MRMLFLSAAVVFFLASGACNSLRSEPASKQTAVSQPETSIPRGQGVLDFPVPGAEELPPSHEGPPLPDTPASAEYKQRRASYQQQLTTQLAEWRVLSLSDEEITARTQQLKRSVLSPPKTPTPPTPTPVGH